MFILTRLLHRIQFRKAIKNDESVNVVDGMVKAQMLYKRLSILAHPDRNPEKRDMAEDLMSRITANRFNYSELLKLKVEAEEKLK